MKKALFVCMGNICRSPTAEAIFKSHLAQQGKLQRWHVDSAGTHAYHLGKAPDSRAQQAALKRGYNLQSMRARQVVAADFMAFDYILVADQNNLRDLKAQQPSNSRAKLALVLDYASKPEWRGGEVPDPYYGGDSGFEAVLDRLEDACAGLLKTES